VEASAQRTPFSRRGAALLVAAIFVAYLPALLHGGFVWDDDRHVTENPALRSWRGLGALWSDASVVPQYYPLTHTSFWVEYRLWGEAPRGYHLVNVALHALAACLLYRALGRLGVPGALFAAALWALHPLQVESVAWISERKNVLSGALFLASVGCWIQALELDDDTARVAVPSGARRRPPAAAVWGAVTYLAALLSKTVTAVLPVTLAIVGWWKGRRPTARRGAYIAAMLVAGALMGALTSWLERNQVGASGPEWSHGPYVRAVLAGRIWWFYLGKLLVPTNLTFIYPRWEVGAGATPWLGWSVAALALLAVLFVARTRIGRGPAAALFYYSAALVPALGFVNVYPMRYSFVADHFQYLAGIGPLALLAAVAAGRTRRWPRLPALASAALVILVLGAATWQRAGVFEGRETLWRDTLRRNPQAWIAHNNLGILEAEAGRPAAAEEHLLRAIELRPGHAGARNNLGWLYLGQGRSAEAVAQLEAAVELAPTDVNARVNLGDALRAVGASARAEASYVAALALEPSHPRALASLADLRLDERRYADAVAPLERLRRLAPDDPQLARGLARALAGAGRREEAASLYRELIGRGDAGAELHYEYGSLLMSMERFEAAAAEFESALALRPGFGAAERGLVRARGAQASRSR
jgi:tetratricopeptide (TPR) repeat protein